MKKAEIYTDGGCSGNPGPGGWAFVMHLANGEIRGSGGEAATTNNRMELLAVINALDELRKCDDIGDLSVAMYTDSVYVKKGITEWMKTWERNGFRTASGTPVKNKDLWLRLKEKASTLTLSWHWVRGHAGNPRNEECDALVQKEIARLKGYR
jgi:ribonuclease HI